MAKTLSFAQSPIEVHRVAGRDLFVKRDDLCAKPPFPPLAKVRGLPALLERLVGNQVGRVGVFESAVSQVGVSLAESCRYFPSLVPYVFFARTINRRYSRSAEAAERAGATLVPLANNVLNVCYGQARRHMQNIGGFLIPFGFEFPESLAAIEREASQVAPELVRGGSLIVSAGSGVTISGILNGLQEQPFSCFAVSTGRSERAIRRCVQRNLRADTTLPTIVPPKWAYSDVPKIEAPFPCDPYYDLKAWAFLVGSIDLLRDPILFWNVGA